MRGDTDEAWSSNNIAHWNLFQSLKDVGVLSDSRQFDPSGAIKMSTLPFWVNGDPALVRQGKISVTAMSLVRTLERTYHGSFATSWTSAKARKELRKLMANSSETIAALGEKVDEAMDFREETQ